MRKIDQIIIHCTATQEGKDYSVIDIRRWHQKRGWSDIGYHYVIHLNGDIEKGRPIERMGAHVRGHNQFSIGIAYIGGVDRYLKPKDTRTIAQKKALKKLVTHLSERFPQATIHGHNEYSNKACPSFKVEPKDFILK